MKMAFNENYRIKIPVIVHLTGLGYTFLPNSGTTNFHTETDIFKELFRQGISKINGTEYSYNVIDKFISELNIQIDNSGLTKRV